MVLRFTEKDYLHQLLQAGLDHVLFILDPDDAQSWEALRDLVNEDIFVTAHLTINARNQADAVVLLSKLKDLGIRSLSLVLIRMKQNKPWAFFSRNLPNMASRWFGICRYRTPGIIRSMLKWKPRNPAKKVQVEPGYMWNRTGMCCPVRESIKFSEISSPTRGKKSG